MKDLHSKITILSGAAKYDASCATSGSSGFQSKGNKIGHTLPLGVCHSWTQDGRCVSLLKVLYSNVCKYDCAYCVNRASADIPRASFTVTELADLTCEFYKRNYIEGLFLSSGIFADPDIVMEKLIDTAKTLRTVNGFGGYIHLKLIPGTGEKTILEAGKWADRLSCNIELPTEKSLKCLAPEKSKEDILGAMNDFAGLKTENDSSRGKKSFFAPAGQSTQLIVGASEEHDRQIINLTSSLYNKFSLKRVYYSAFIFPTPGEKKSDPRLPEIIAPPLVREHRLYQADWLLRFYHFKADEILSEDAPFLDSLIDPKTVWALKNLDFFPIEINRADYETLLRIPGIGAKTARRIIENRRARSLSIENLARMGAVLKRGRYFLTANGKHIERPDDPARIRRLLEGQDGAGLQLPLFDF
ncbi:MAG: putative DNA modification/repair radical SAM protein [Treponema sp.]|jgi:putative DNA modification/repair radical SAM protein|nr:putative DNA modification/repair radical SAM protein [Treponema sp.]